MLRLFVAVLLLLISLLAIVKAPTYHTWLLSVAVTEYPLLFILISLSIFFAGFWLNSYKLAGTLASLLACCIYVYPVISAFSISKTLEQDINKAYSFGSDSSGKRFSFGKLFTSNYNKVVGHETIAYAVKDIPLTMDFYSSILPGKRPCIIVIHGGSWSSGNSSQLPELNSYLANSGYNVAAINYRKASKYQNPAPMEDVGSALTFLKQHADSLQVDETRFVLLGRSAGAQIALLSAYTFHDQAIKGVISFYGPADMVWGYSRPSNPLVMNSRRVMENYLGGTYSQVPENYFRSSPLEFVDSESPPTLMLHGKNDVLVAYEHNLHLIERLKKYHVPYLLLSIPYAAHGFDFNLNGPSGQLSTWAVEKFIRNYTR